MTAVITAAAVYVAASLAVVAWPLAELAQTCRRFPRYIGTHRVGGAS